MVIYSLSSLKFLENQIQKANLLLRTNQSMIKPQQTDLLDVTFACLVPASFRLYASAMRSPGVSRVTSTGCVGRHRF